MRLTLSLLARWWLTGKNGLLWDARLDNNDMQYAIRICAINKGGSLSNEGGKLTVKGADEVV